jgi:hypothetical protein
MRFRRSERHVAPGLTARKVAAIKQRQRREQARYPLLAEQIAEQQAPIDLSAEEQARRMQFEKSQQSMRDLHARFWRDARRRYFAATAEQRVAIQSEWNRWAGPLEATYFSYVVDKNTGESDRRLAAMKANMREVAARVRAETGHQGNLFG